MRKAGINISKNIVYGTQSFIDCITEAGFESVFTVGNDKEFIQYVSERCGQKGLLYESLHAPWKNINELWRDTPATEELMKDLFTSVDLAAAYSIPIVVAHISSGDNCPPVTDAGLKNFDSFVNYAAKKNITIAVENQRKLGNIATIFEIYGKDTNVAFCWDVGHEKCFAHGREYMPLFGDRCVITHIHDNFCRYNGDDHLLPYDGCIDFRHTAELIHDADYQGTLMLETDHPHEGSDKYSGLSLEQYVSKAFAAVNRLRIIADY